MAPGTSEQSVLVLPVNVKSLNARTTQVPLSVGLDVVQIGEQGWYELCCLSSSSTVLMGVCSRSAGCKWTFMEEPCVRRCIITHLIL